MDSPPASPKPPEAAVRAASDDGVMAATIGTLIFVIALVGCLLQRDELAARGDRWWIWTCVSGVVVGVLFRAFAGRRARAYREHARATGSTEQIRSEGH